MDVFGINSGSPQKEAFVSSAKVWPCVRNEKQKPVKLGAGPRSCATNLWAKESEGFAVFGSTSRTF